MECKRGLRSVVVEPKLKVVIVGANGFTGSALLKVLAKRADIEVLKLGRPEFDLTFVDQCKLPPSVDCLVIASGVTVGTNENLQQINAVGPARLVELLRKRGLKKVIYLSSGAVYGDVNTQTHIKTETKPDSSYGKSKLYGEQCIEHAAKGIEFSCLRLYFPYGPGQVVPRLIPRLVDNIKRGQPIFCRNDGGPYLSLTHIDDLVKILTEDFILKSYTGIFNIASNQIISIQKIAEMIAGHLNIVGLAYQTSNSNDCISQTYEHKSDWKWFSCEGLE
jgi:nucleoside-diphosphate-sugar epimerase